MTLDKKDGAVKIKASSNQGLMITLHRKASLAEIEVAVRGRLSGSSSFFRHAEIKLDLGDRDLVKEEIETIRSILEDEFELHLAKVLCSPTSAARKLQADLGLGLPVEPTGQKELDDNLKVLDPGTLIVRHTCRSGTKIDHDGDIVVLGDVNSGAEIVAGRDIIILGTLRGVAHAGAQGNKSAVIIALSIQPKRLQIGDITALPPLEEETSQKSDAVPEIAFIGSETIVITQYKGRIVAA